MRDLAADSEAVIVAKVTEINPRVTKGGDGLTQESTQLTLDVVRAIKGSPGRHRGKGLL